MVLRASSPEAKAEWMEAFREAMSDLFSREEIEHKRIAEMELRPMMLKSESLQFERRQIILQNLEVIIGMPDAFEKKGPRTRREPQGKQHRGWSSSDCCRPQPGQQWNTGPEAEREARHPRQRDDRQSPAGRHSSPQRTQ